MTGVDFERIVEQIHRQCSPKAEVRHNERIKGRAGRMRQLDVTVRGRIGPYSIFIVVECKDQSRPVGIDQVEAFAKKLEDVGASQGVLVSRSGFDEGAKAIASTNDIRLLNYREAEATDWGRIIGDNVNFFFTVLEIQSESTSIDCVDDSDEPLEDNDIILSPSGHSVGTVKEVRALITSDIVEPAQLLGHYEVRVRMDGFVLQSSSGSAPIRTMTVRGRKVARRYYVRAGSPAGHILEDALNGGLPYAELEQSIPWKEVTAESQGRELSIEEYTETPRQTVAPISVRWTERDGQLRLTFIRTAED